MMTKDSHRTTDVPTLDQPHWAAVFSLALGVSGLVISEFLPIGILTPMASDLGITEGMAGQAVTATSVFAVVSSLLTAFVTRKVNRKHVLLTLSFLMLCSNLMVWVAPDFWMLMAGRVLLGISLGGFWSMAAAIAMRLVPSDSLPKALSILFGGSSFASIIAASMGSYLGGLMGWRNVFSLLRFGPLGHLWFSF
ncbi:MAG: MFS transporter [Bdellovibrionota bacterium]